MNAPLEICSLCSRSRDAHDPATQQCPPGVMADGSRISNPANRFASKPMPPTPPNDQICRHPECGKPLSHHYRTNVLMWKENEWKCPSASGWHPTNCFTPWRETQSQLRAIHDAMNADIESDASISSQHPPGRSPFDLKLALAGARLVTRDGRQVTAFKLRALFGSSAFPYQAVIMHHIRYFYPNGCYNESSESESDLFLAAPLAGEKCEHPGLCPHCAAGYFLPSGVCDHCNLRRNEPGYPTTPTHPESETQRQARVMLAFDAGETVERRYKHYQGPIHWEIDQNPEWNWSFYDYCIRTSAPAQSAPKPRRVWVEFNAQGQTRNVDTIEWRGDQGERLSLVEFIELAPILAMPPEERERFFREEGK